MCLEHVYVEHAEPFRTFPQNLQKNSTNNNMTSSEQFVIDSETLIVIEHAMSDKRVLEHRAWRTFDGSGTS